MKLTPFGSMLINAVFSNRGEYSLLASLIDKFTRIKPKYEDFNVQYEIEKNKLTIVVEGTTPEGKFALQRMYDRECEDQLNIK